MPVRLSGRDRGGCVSVELSRPTHIMTVKKIFGGRNKKIIHR